MPNSDITDKLPDAMQSMVRSLRICFYLLVFAMFAALFFFLWNSFFVVKENKYGLILRFGSLVSKNDSLIMDKGFHLTFPYPIDENIEIDRQTREIVSDEFWHLDKKDANHDDSSYNLTGDMNILHSKWILKYNIKDPVNYYKNFYNTDNENYVDQYLIKLLNNAVTHVMASMTIDDAYPQALANSTQKNTTRNLPKEIESRLTKKLNDLNFGVELESVLQEEISPPPELIEAFNRLSSAASESQTIISQAKDRDRLRIMNEATVESSRIISEAGSAVKSNQLKLKSEIAEFEKLYVQYKKNPDLFKHLYVQDRIKRIVKQVDKKYIINSKKNREIRIEIDSSSGVSNK
jgi:membrane protease subunit HflK